MRPAWRAGGIAWAGLVDGSRWKWTALAEGLGCQSSVELAGLGAVEVHPGDGGVVGE